MTRWFVFTNECYYPSGEVVEAATAEEALAIANHPGKTASPGSAVFPCDAVAHLVKEWPS